MRWRGLYLFILFEISSCSEIKPPENKDDSAFIPRRVGHELIYLVKESSYGAITMMREYRERYYTDHIIFNPHGDSLFVVYVAEIDNYKNFITHKDNWIILFNESLGEITVTEGNQKYLRLIVPLSGFDWDLNKYKAPDERFPGSVIPNTCHVEILDDDYIRVVESNEGRPLVDRRYSEYKRKVGLVKREDYLEEWRTISVTRNGITYDSSYLFRLLSRQMELIE